MQTLATTTAAFTRREAADGDRFRPRLPTGRNQATLRLGSVDDAAERQAEAMATAVMGLGGPLQIPSSNAAHLPDRLQRRCACGGQCPVCRADESDRAGESLQRKSVSPDTSHGAPAPPMVHEALNGPGQPLDAFAGWPRIGDLGV